jgi:hypothetical protein
MKQTTLLSKIVIITLLILGITVAASYADEEPEKGLSGFIILGGGFSDGDLSLDDAELKKNDRITSLSQNNRSFSEFIPVIAGKLSYTAPDSGTTLTLGGEQGLALTVSQETGQYGSFYLGGSFAREDVYKDPFQTHTDRAKTDQDTIGVHLGWDNIMSSNLSFGYEFESLDIDDDVAGNRNSTLKRDGNIHTFSLGSELYDDKQNEIEAGLFYSYGDLSGSSNAFHGYGAGLGHTFNGGSWKLETEVGFGFLDYDKSHPEFNKTREDTVFSASTSFTKFAPFGFTNFFWTVFAGYDSADSNIDFYDNNAVTVGAGVGYHF